jgi:hypothetical protein
VFVARPPAKRAFTGPAEFLADAANRARVGEYLADMARPYGREVPAAQFGEPPSPDLGHSYGEMAEALIESAVPAGEPVDLLVLAFSIHDLRPGRQTAAYLSHLTAGAPMAFAVTDQGSAAAFSGLRIACDYAASADVRRALLIVVEQAALPYDCPVAVPAQHRGVAMLYSDRPPEDGPLDANPPEASPPEANTAPQARLADVRQHAGVPPGEVAGLAAADLGDLVAADHQEVALVLSDALAAVWAAPEAGRVRVAPPGQPATGVWWELMDELAADAGGPDLLVAADYDPDLGYLSLAAFTRVPRLASTGRAG